jgi:hypothetical protein
MPKSDKILLRELREDLRYWQGMARIDARSLIGSRNKCKEIAAKMRALQPKPERTLRPADWRPGEFDPSSAEQAKMILDAR